VTQYEVRDICADGVMLLWRISPKPWPSIFNTFPGFCKKVLKGLTTLRILWFATVSAMSQVFC